MYVITNYTKKAARRLGVKVKRSMRQGKKLDVFSKDGKLLASVGALGYKDYPTYLKTEGREVADARRKAYKARHNKHRHRKGTASYYADRLLW